MQGNYVFVFTVIFGLLMLLVQRTEARSRRRAGWAILFVTVIVLWRFVEIRQLQGEVLLSTFFALMSNFLFWLFIGRYNPVGTSDNIQVLGMDD